MKDILLSTTHSFSWWDQNSTTSSWVPYRDLRASPDILDRLKAPKDRFENAVLTSELMSWVLGAWSGCLNTLMFS